MHHIGFHIRLIVNEFIRQLKISDLVMVFKFKIRRDHNLMLGQETAGLFAVAGGCFGFRPVILVHIKSNTFMDGSIFLRQIVVVLIIRIEIFPVSYTHLDV